MPTAPTAHTPLPAAPSTDDPANFDTEADAFVGALETFGDQMDALATNAYNNAVEANADAIATAADRVQTGLDREQTGLDRTAAANSATAAAASEAAAAGSASTAAGWSATSTTSMALTSGSKTLTIQTAKQFTAGTNIKVKRTAAPTTTYAHTTVDTYNSGTGALTFTLASDLIVGSGTYTDWTIELSGARGATGPEGTVPQGVYSDIAAAFVYIAELTGTAAGMAAGVADAFEDESGVDTASSTNEVYDSTNDRYGSITTLPLMTSNSLPTGNEASASSNNAGNPSAEYYAFDGATTVWASVGNTVPAWIKRKTPSAVTLYSYAITANADNEAPQAWTLQGSNDDSSWTDIDTRSGQSFTTAQKRSFSIASLSGPYLYHRLYITTGSTGSSIKIRELELVGLYAMSLRSVAYTATSAPTTARFSVSANLGGGTINTALIAYASRDNGTTWTAVTLTAGRTLGDGTTIYEGSASISAQPSGTSMKWRVDTTDDYNVSVSSVVFQWS